MMPMGLGTTPPTGDKAMSAIEQQQYYYSQMIVH